MQYYIDGYNLLFKASWTHLATNLEKMREELLVDLNEKARFLNLQFVIVFDAPQQTDEMRRSHFQALEIIFSSYGQTADDLLIEMLEHHKTPQNVILVTSDKSLQRKAKAVKAQVQTIDEFLKTVQKKWLKKKKKQKEEKTPPLKTALQDKVQERKAKKDEPIDTSGKLPPLSDLAKWEKLFKARLQDSQDN